NLIKHFNDNWATQIVSVIAAGIKSKVDTCDEFYDFNNSQISLCKRVRYVRLKSGNIKYWNGHFDETGDVAFSILIFIVWATPKTIMELYNKTNTIIEKFSVKDYIKIDSALKKVAQFSELTSHNNKIFKEFLEARKSDHEL